MREVLMDIFGDFGRIIVFIHVVSATLLVGGLFILRFISYPVFSTIKSQEERYTKILALLNKFGKTMFFVMIILIMASVFMNIGMGFKYGNPTTYIMIHTKEAIWTFIAFNFVYMYIKYRCALKANKNKEYIEVHENIILIINYLVPLNFILSLIAIYFGIILRGF